MPGPQKLYPNHFNKCPATAEQIERLRLLAAATGKAPASLQRESWDFYCESETIAALLRKARDEQIKPTQS